MRIICLPIDSRPCNTQFLQRLVSWAGSELILPRSEEMDDFTRPASFEASVRFLEREAPGADAAIISLDHLCYGGLLASRTEEISGEEALSRVQWLRAWVEKVSFPVYMSSVLLRSSLSALSVHDLDVYHAMTEFSIYSDRVARFHMPEDEEKLASARCRIPTEILERTLRIRARNLRVNEAAVHLAEDGHIAWLSLLQEDCQEYGLTKQDQRAVEACLRENTHRNARLRDGTDEAGAVLAAKALWGDRPLLEAEVRWIGSERFMALYEDRPFRENLRTARHEIGIKEEEGSDTVICVCCPENGDQWDAHDSVPSEWVKSCARIVDHAIREGKRVYLLDLLRANSGVPELLLSMEEREGLWGYSAWNTASNAMGTLLAQVISDAIAGKPNRAYYQERLLDDLVYQGHIRDLLNDQLTALGEDVYHLQDKARAELLLRGLYRQELPKVWPLQDIPDYQVSLPWSRTFEVFAEVKDYTSSR